MFMNQLLFAVLLFSPVLILADDIPDGGHPCHKCQVIREYHEKHPEENYYWYDDYLKDNKNKGTEDKSQIPSKQTDSSPQKS
jgi:hypothetical protein